MLKLKDFQDKSMKKIVSLLEDTEKKEIVIESPNRFWEDGYTFFCNKRFSRSR